MHAREYQDMAMRTRGNFVNNDEQLIAAGLGIAGEAGEVADTIKKVEFHGHALDRQMVAQELGDVLWYVALMCDAIEVSMMQVMAMNIEKLRKRYPEGFSSERSLNRTE